MVDDPSQLSRKPGEFANTANDTYSFRAGTILYQLLAYQILIEPCDTAQKTLPD